ncbi:MULTISPECIES: GrlR family regulatory protein [Pseudomonas syringae group]|uniref:Uncharacterized protein n=3 Tax=Pseudomonas syringae TaxID=317 RepID=A0A656K203_PSESF|nr:MULTISPECIES: GrlR family regulatory protein [Pseudomonas syringae group]EPM92047.1 hypothetical protein A259_37626 [Pseudomonas syringae pv. actinidiae ICMP 19070]EPN65764.1 hypothetical protein A245_07594 [Pseudomonas syringae pv. actinidiae ICMP 19096]AQL37441.1 hypothetical protein JN853_13890 [Pseudomonas syringae pv. actinidiae ICMP 9853]EGH68747.1 hypothetical protein PSYAC_28463 [Pseudomonas syringae pv. actinidiae str. M302091]EPM44382.1 hypothetical protein A246_22981 [Pseudomonas
MSQGIFHVKFKANTQDFGEGLVVVKSGAANGGDENYLYQGAIPSVSGEFTSDFEVSQWQAGNTDVFGGSGGFVLKARGVINYENGTFSLQGSPEGKPEFTLEAIGRKVAETI